MADDIMTYVFDSKEVYLTGRMAKNKRGKVLVEIVPIGTTSGDTAYAKWVASDELFTISTVDELDVDE